MNTDLALLLLCPVLALAVWGFATWRRASELRDYNRALIRDIEQLRTSKKENNDPC